MNNDDINDGIRYHNTEQITKIDRWIKSYLELENIGHVDLSEIDINDRIKFILSKI
jgi:hypothetical protein